MKIFIQSIRSGSIRNLESARVSIIGQLKKFNTDLETGVKNLGSQSHMVMQTDLAEEDEGDDANSNRKKMARVSLDNSEDDFIKPDINVCINQSKRFDSMILFFNYQIRFQ